MGNRIFLTNRVVEQHGEWLSQGLRAALFDVWQEGDLAEVKPDLVVMAAGQDMQFIEAVKLPVLFISDQWEAGGDDCVPAHLPMIIAAIRSLIRQNQARYILHHYTDLAYHNGLFTPQAVSADPAHLLVFADEASTATLEIQLHDYHYVFGADNINDPEGIIVKDDLEKLINIAAHPEAKNIAVLFWSDDQEKIIRALDAGVEAYIPNLGQAEPRITKQIYNKRKEKLLQKNLNSTLDMAAKDSLTGLYNRRCLAIHLPSLIKQVVNIDKKRLAVILLDLDRFKHINDHWGHSIGDSILQRVAELLQKALRSDDMLYRIGGEEFLALAPNIGRIDEAYGLAQRLCHAIGNTHFVVGKEVVPLTISAGVSIFQRGERVQNLLKRADQALYRAKRLGRNQAA